MYVDKQSSTLACSIMLQSNKPFLSNYVEALIKNILNKLVLMAFCITIDLNIKFTSDGGCCGI